MFSPSAADAGDRGRGYKFPSALNVVGDFEVWKAEMSQRPRRRRRDSRGSSGLQCLNREGLAQTSQGHLEGKPTLYVGHGA